MSQIVNCFYRYPVVGIGVIRWVEAVVMEPSYFKLSTEHTPTHIALLDEIVSCHPLLHQKVLDLLIKLFESKQDELEILVQVSLIMSFYYSNKLLILGVGEFENFDYFF